MPTESPSLGRNGGHQGSVALAWVLQHLVSLGPGPASCLGLGGAGGSPIWAPSQNLPLSLVTAASLCLAWVQPPHTSPLRAAAPPSKSSGLGGIGQGLTLSLGLSFFIWNVEAPSFGAFRPCPSGILGPPGSML